MAPSVEISPAFACTTAPCRKETKRKPTRPTVSRMMPPPGLQIYLRHRATLSFDLLAPKFDRFMTLPRFNRFKTLLLVLLLRLLNPHILKSLHWLKVNERIEYKLLSLTYKVLTTAQPSYLHNLISLQPPHSTRSSSVVTLSRPKPANHLLLENHR